MAIITQSLSTYRESTVNPNGNEYGSSGDKLKFNNSVYECINNTTWRIIEKEGTSLLPRQVDSDEELISIENAKVGEVITVKGKGVDKLRSLSNRDYIVTHEFSAYAKSLKTTDLDTGVDGVWRTGNVSITTSQEVRVVIKINSYIQNQTGTTSRIIQCGTNRLGHLYNSLSGDTATTALLRHDSTITINYVKEFETGFVVDGLTVSCDRWYEVSLNFLTDAVITPFILGQFIPTNGTTYEYKEIEVVGLDKWELNQTSGTTIIGNSGTTFTLQSGKTANWVDYKTSTKFSKLLNNTAIANVVIKNNIITPFDLGFDPSLNNELQDTNYADEYIQFCFDSDYTVELPPANYCLSSGVEVKKPKNIILHGRDINAVWGDKNTNPDWVSYYKNNKNTTVLYSHNNIDMISLKSHSVIFKGGVILTGLIPSHTKWGFKVDINYDITNCDISSVVYGNVEALQSEGIGTLGCGISSREADTNIGIGYVSGNDFNFTLYGCHTGLDIDNLSFKSEEEIRYNAYFINWNNWKLYTKACKKHVDVKLGGLSTYKIWSQMGDENILVTPTEQAYNGVYINVNSSYIDAYPMDADDARTGTKIKIEGNYNTLGEQTIYQQTIGRVTYSGKGTQYNIGVPNDITILNSPNKHLITAINNEIAYYGDKYDGLITVKHFDAPNLEWFDTNLDDSETEGLVVDTSTDASSDTMSSFGGILTSEWKDSSVVSTNQIKTGKETGFIEIVIPMDGVGMNFPVMLNALVSIVGSGFRMGQIIVKTTDGVFYSNKVDSFSQIKNLSLGRIYNKNTAKLIIRLIGSNYEYNGNINCINSYNDNDRLTNIEDVGTSTATLEAVTGESSVKTNSLKSTILTVNGGFKMKLPLVAINTIYYIDVYAKIGVGNTGTTTISLNDFLGSSGVGHYAYTPQVVTDTEFTKYHFGIKTSATVINRYLQIVSSDIGDVFHVERVTIREMSENTITDLVYIGEETIDSPIVKTGGDQDIYGLKNFNGGIILNNSDISGQQLPYKYNSSLYNLESLLSELRNAGIIYFKTDVVPEGLAVSATNDGNSVVGFSGGSGVTVTADSVENFSGAYCAKLVAADGDNDRKNFTFTNLEVGVEYELRVMLKMGSGYVNGGFSTFSQFDENIQPIINHEDWREYVYTVTPSVSNPYIAFYASKSLAGGGVAGNTLYIDSLSLTSSIQKYLGDTGTEIFLDRPSTRAYNMALASSATTYTYNTDSLYIGGNAMCLINAETEPTITGATKVKGSTFIPNTDMHMAVWYYGVTVQFNFIEL